MDWYYLSDTHERIAVSEAQLAPLAARGVIRPATPVWRRGMGDWAACGEVKPEIFTAAVSGSDDPRHPAAESMALRGAVMGLARTLAGYNVWLRIYAIFFLVVSLVMSLAVIVQLYFIIKKGTGSIGEVYPELGEIILSTAVIFAVLAGEVIILLVTVWSSILLLCAASRARRAAHTGNEHLLASAIRGIGRYFLITTIMLILSMIGWLTAVTLIGWDKAFPSREPSAEKVISI